MVGAVQNRVSADDRASTAVLEAVAAEEGCEPTELDVPLYEHVDPEALDALVSSPLSGHVSFTYHGYELTVDGGGAVRIDGRA